MRQRPSRPDGDTGASQCGLRALARSRLCGAGEGGGSRAARAELGAVANLSAPPSLRCKVGWYHLWQRVAGGPNGTKRRNSLSLVGAETLAQSTIPLKAPLKTFSLPCSAFPSPCGTPHSTPERGHWCGLLSSADTARGHTQRASWEAHELAFPTGAPRALTGTSSRSEEHLLRSACRMKGSGCRARVVAVGGEEGYLSAKSSVSSHSGLQTARHSPTAHF